MANYTATTDMTLEEAIAAGSMANGENLTINNGAVITMTQTASILLGDISIIYGKLSIRGDLISAGNVINLVGEYNGTFDVLGAGRFETVGDWFDIGTTDGTDSQVIDLSTYWGGEFVDCVPMIQVETGRRIDFDNAIGLTPEVDDFVTLVSNRSVMGRIVEVQPTYLVVKYLSGTLANDDNIQIRKVVDNLGPDLQVTWTAQVNNVSGDIKEAGIYQEFANTRHFGTSYIADFNHGVGGFVFDNAFQSTDLTLGSSAGDTGGFVPPSGCNIRIPNIHISTSNTTNFPLGLTYHSGSTDERLQYQLNTSSAGEIDMYCTNTGMVFWTGQNAYIWVSEFCGAFSHFGSSSTGTPSLFKSCACAPNPVVDAPALGYAFMIYDSPLGGSIIDCISATALTTRQLIGAENSNDVIVKGCISTSSGSGTDDTYKVHHYYAYVVVGALFENNIAVGGQNISSFVSIFNASAASNVTIKNMYISCTPDETPSPLELSTITLTTGCSNFLIVGVEIIGNGIGGNYLVSIIDSSEVKVRCMGMIDDKLDSGTNGEALVFVSGLAKNIDIARIWGTSGEWGDVVYDGAICNGFTITNCSGDYASGFSVAGYNQITKGLQGASGTPGSSYGIEDILPATYGRQVFDGFRSDTTGWLVVKFIPPSPTVNNINVIAGSPRFPRDGKAYVVSGDIFEISQDYFMRGHIAFSGLYTVEVTNSDWYADEAPNLDIEFQYDIGAGFNGTWLDMRTASNLTSITINPAIGVKLKFRLTANANYNGISSIILDTTTSIAFQKANLYPIDQIEYDFSFTLSPSITGYEWRLYEVDALGSLAGAIELAGQETATIDNQTYTYVHTADKFVAVQIICGLDNDFVESVTYYTLSNENQNIPIILTRDINN